MNSGLVEARELAARISRIERARGATTLLDEFATETRDGWQWLLSAGGAVRERPGVDPWVRMNAARILACIPASAGDLQPLIEQIGLTSAP